MGVSTVKVVCIFAGATFLCLAVVGGIIGAIVAIANIEPPPCPWNRTEYYSMTMYERDCITCRDTYDDDDFILEDSCYDARCLNNTYGEHYCYRPRGSSYSGSYSGGYSRRYYSSGGGGRGGFCFPPDTLVVLSSQDAVPISTLHLGDQLELGGTVRALMQLEGSGDPLFDVGGVRVSGSHAVRDPRDGVWRRAEHAGRPLNTTVPVLWSVITEHHRVVALPSTHGSPSLELADFMEVDDTPALLQRNLQVLNGDKDL